MHPYLNARATPDKPACIMAGSNETVTYRQLDERSNQAAQLFRALGLRRGDVVALWAENHTRYFDIAWATQRAGLYLVCISSRANAAEVEYIVNDCGAKLLITSSGMGPLVDAVAAWLPAPLRFIIGQPRAAYESWEAGCDAMPRTPIADESSGVDMLYSSGTTGRSKGVKHALPEEPVETPTLLVQLAQALYGLSADSVYLSPAPLYHAAPLRWSMTVHRLGGTVVMMDKFDPETALALIERHRVNCAQWVPTHFVRMLKLPAEVRARYDVSSLKVAIHAAAPCPIHVKEQMIDWWGPILYEYYAGTEGNGMTLITSKEWLNKKGSVGRAVSAELKICDEQGEPVPPFTEGTVYFAGGRKFEYHNAPEKTAEATNRYGWTTLGDVGYVDHDGYLYLTDRKAFTIISGGVNVYPQEVENLLLAHPKVMDAAVFGAPDEEMGEKVVAVVQPVRMTDAGSNLAEELIAFARANLSHVKVPKVIDFTPELPRHPNGKLYKRLLRDRYRAKAAQPTAGASGGVAASSGEVQPPR
jgi:acyl-CoA synthetase (AMP-forming)/AMP-acid ligase II